MTTLMTFLQIGLWKSIHDKNTVGSFSLSQMGAVVLFNTNINMSVVIAGLGFLGGILSIVKNGMSAYREYLALKKDLKTEPIPIKNE